MWIWGDSFTAALTAGGAEAQLLGARTFGSEHALLGLLVAGDAVTDEVVTAAPVLTPEAVRAAVDEAIDDGPHLRRLGLDPGLPARLAHEGRAGVPVPRKHTAEFQVALNDSTAKTSHLVRRRALGKATKLSAAHLWLAVLEPSSRASRLIEALGARPEELRPVVLAAMAGGGAVPEWPDTVRRGLVDRLSGRLFERINIAG